MRVLVGHAAKIHVEYVDADGELATATNAITVKVFDGADGEREAGAASEAGTGIYEFTLPAQDTLDRLRVEWEEADPGTWKATTYVDVVGARLVSLQRLRSAHGLTTASPDRLRELRDLTEEVFRDAVGFPVVAEGKRLDLVAHHGPRLLLPGVLFPIGVYSVTQGGDAVDISTLRVGGGFVEWTSSARFKPQRVSIHLAHGLVTPPESLSAAAVTYAVYRNRRPDEKIPERATRVITEGADMLLGTPDDDHPTGIPDVDSVLVGMRQHVPV